MCLFVLGVLNGVSDDSTSSDDDSDDSDDEHFDIQFADFFPGKVKTLTRKKG